MFHVFLDSAFKVPETPNTWMAAFFPFIAVVEAMAALTCSSALWEQRITN